MIEAPKQIDLFTGELRDARTQWQKALDQRREAPQQTEMFAQREIAQFGVRSRPQMSLSPHTKLVLISEDPRTEDEIERDRMREAEALTDPLFAEIPELSGEDKPERVDPATENAHEQPEQLVASEAVTKLSAYRALVTLVREQAVTVWVDGAYRQRFYSQLPLTVLSAQGAGLTAAEISTAMQIGEFLGNRERQSARRNSDVIFDARGANGSPLGDAAKSAPAYPSRVLSPQTATRGAVPHEGLRMRLRRERIAVRTRQPQPKAPEVVPTLWMEREHILKRLPYLAEGIVQLDEDELASLAESISEVLQEAYWTILGITLAHFLNYEQGAKTT